MNKEIPTCIEDIFYKIGFKFQMQDNYLNFNGKQIKKTSNDLEEKKLTRFTSKLQNDNDPDIIIFYEKGIITEKLNEKIKNLMKVYEIEIHRLVEELYAEMDKKNLVFLKEVVKMF